MTNDASFFDEIVIVGGTMPATDTVSDLRVWRAFLCVVWVQYRGYVPPTTSHASYRHATPLLYVSYRHGPSINLLHGAHTKFDMYCAPTTFVIPPNKSIKNIEISICL